MGTLRETNFTLPGQTGEVYRGKVGDVYPLEHHGQELLAVVRTDRISAYDVVLPDTIPHKGQVLNQTSVQLLNETGELVPNWLISEPDPNVSLGYKASPFKIEMIMRAYLLGSSWKAYRDEGLRNLCDNPLPNGMREFDPFERAILTPTTKADEGHDENITPTEIVRTGLATTQEFERMEWMARFLFLEGQHAARQRGLELVDTKYEFGKLPNGEIVVIDEVHTPDSSRYFPADEYKAYLKGATSERPRQMSKEFVREWLTDQGFTGQEDQEPPVMPEEFRQEVSQRYIDLYETMTGKTFEAADAETSEGLIRQRIRQNIVRSLESLSL